MADNAQFTFSICVPTRARGVGLIRLIKSINNTANKPSKIEIVLRIDEDDIIARSSAKEIQHNQNIKCNIKKIILPRNEFLSDLWEDCYQQATSNRLMMCADDCIFRTAGWDTIIAEASPNPGCKPYFLYANDLLQGKGLAVFPIMSRAWVECVGYFVPRGYRRDWCDTHLHDIATRVAADDRIDGRSVKKYFKEVVCEHMHPAAGKAKWDKTYTYRLKMKCESGQYNNRTQERIDKADSILQYMLHGLVPSGPGAPLDAPHPQTAIALFSRFLGHAVEPNRKD